MALWDLHIHTTMSFDGRDHIDAMCESAIKKGLTGIAVTNHLDYDGIKSGIYPPYDPEGDLRQIREAREKFKGQLDIKFGIEIGQANTHTAELKRFIRDAGFEYILSSLHNMPGAIDFYYYNFEKMSERERIYRYEKYLDELMLVLDAIPADTLGHITYPIRYMKRAGADIDINLFEKRFETLFKLMVMKGTALEVNVSDLRTEVNATLPEPCTVELYRACGGKRVAVGSDAHRAEHVGVKVEETAKFYSDLGMEVVNLQKTITGVNERS